MRLTYWAMAALLISLLAAYSVVRDSSGVCQVPHSITYRVFR
ncbi:MULTISPECIES: hypothetical protein [unclassified Pseudomonas]|nr:MULTISPECIES: hypothetical protein [unclassified Pseudomonas]